MTAFGSALIVQYLVVDGGLAALPVSRRRARRVLADDEGVVVDPLRTAVAEAIRRRSVRA